SPDDYPVDFEDLVHRELPIVVTACEQIPFIERKLLVLGREIVACHRHPAAGHFRTTIIKPDAHASSTDTNSLRRSRSSTKAGTFGACPSGQFGCGRRSSMT